MMITTGTVKERLRSAIAEKHELPEFELSEDTWVGLVDGNFFEDYKAAQNPDEQQACIREMVKTVEQWYRLTGRPLGSPEPAPVMMSRKIAPESQGRRVRNPKLRQQAVSVRFAHLAAKDDRVIAFRRDVLKQQLLTPERVRDWIEDQAKRDGRSNGTVWLKVPIPDEYKVTRDRNGWFTSPPLTISRRRSVRSDKVTTKQLSFGVPGDPYIHWTSVSSGGVLDRLRKISKSLTKQFPWDEGQATIFVLTGVPPLAEPLRVTLKPRGGIPVAARIVLEIDPALSPREVADAYVKQRRSFLGEGRFRSLDEKHLHLAMFSADRPEGESLAASLERWNKFCEAQKRRDWKYRAKSLTNFGRDLTGDPKRLLYPGRTRFVPYGFTAIGQDATAKSRASGR